MNRMVLAILFPFQGHTGVITSSIVMCWRFAFRSRLPIALTPAPRERYRCEQL